jgi:hypothetical protein
LPGLFATIAGGPGLERIFPWSFSLTPFGGLCCPSGLA